MSKLRAYINGAAAISPQKTFEAEGFLTEPIEYTDNFLVAIDGDYKQYINPVAIRRMSRIMKMGLSTAKNALAQSGIEVPDAIITGTGYGCIDDTEKFLLSMLENKEQLLNPTAFMQSTHNSVSGIIALNIKCLEYNYTYVHRGFSFDHCVVDAMMLLNEGRKNVLIGGFDENSINHQVVATRIGFFKKEKIKTFDLLQQKTPGAISGEGASFFLLSNEKNEKTLASLDAVKMLYKPKDENAVEQSLAAFLEREGLRFEDIDLVLSGINGDANMDHYYYHLLHGALKHASQLYFKHLCGDYYTDTAFALWMAANILQRNHIPEIIRMNEVAVPSAAKRILIYNHYRGINHSFYLLSK
jgi:3-oxoacyl-(acyl-carrier-protein) synthase